MCIQTRIQKILAEKEALDAKITRLEKLEVATAPVKDLLSKLLADYADEAPEDLAALWEEILAIGRQYGVSVQPLAADELRQWEAVNAENQETKRQYLELLEASANKVKELNQENKNLRVEIERLESEIEAHSQSLLPDLHHDDQSELATGNSDPIPALTLWQPWATLIALGNKKIETRKWPTAYRGPLAIHAAKRPTDWSTLNENEYELPEGGEWPLGAVVAICDLLDCVEMTPEFIAAQTPQERALGLWKPGRFAWVLENIRPVVPPVPAIGGQKLWSWSGTSIAAKLEDLGKLKAEPEQNVMLIGNEDETPTLKSVLESNGFFQFDADMPPDWDTSELYENYRGWDIFYSFPNGGIVAIGLSDHESKQFWEANTEYIQEIEGNAFPESLADYDEIVAWTKQLIDQVVAATPVESLEAPSQLALEFPKAESETVLTGDEYDAAAEEELALDDEEDKPTNLYLKFHGKRWEVTVINRNNGGISFLFQTGEEEECFTGKATPEEVAECNGSVDACVDMLLARRFAKEVESKKSTPDELTKLQKLLEGTNNYIFEKLGARVKIDSEFIENNHGEELEVTEEALFTVADLDGGKVQHYYHSVEDLTEWKPIAGWNPLGNLMNTAENYAKKWVKEQSLDTERTNPKTETQFEAMGYMVQVYPQLPMGVTFRFLNADATVAFSNSLTTPEIADRSWKACAYDLIQDYRDKEAARLEKLANPHATEEDKFVELVKISNCVGYLKRRDNGEILSGYAAFSMRDEEGEKLNTFAKPRATKWAEYLRANNEASEEGGNSRLVIGDPRKSKRLVSDNPKQVFVYEIKLAGVDLGYLERLAQLDLSSPPGNFAVKKPSTAKLPTEVAPTYRVTVNGFEIASGTKEKMQSHFEQELKTFGDKGRLTIKLMCGAEEIEAYYYDDFAFVLAQDFDEENPEYFTVYKPTKNNFRVYRSLASGSNWMNSIYPYPPNLFTTKEAAAVDAVRRQLKAKGSTK